MVRSQQMSVDAIIEDEEKLLEEIRPKHLKRCARCHKFTRKGVLTGCVCGFCQDEVCKK